MCMLQQNHPALTLLREAPTRFANQGTVVETWRTYRGRRLGPYYRLTWREDGRQRAIYLGRQGPLVEEVRRLLHEAQTIRRMIREHRRRQAEFKEHVIRPLQQYVKEMFRLFGNGLYVKGSDIGGIKTAGPRLTTADVPAHLIPEFPLPLPSFLAQLHTTPKRERGQKSTSPSAPGNTTDSPAAYSPSSKTASENRRYCVSDQKTSDSPRAKSPDHHRRQPRKNVDQKRPWLADLHSPLSPQQHRHPEALLKSVDQKHPYVPRGPPVHVTSSTAPNETGDQENLIPNALRPADSSLNSGVCSVLHHLRLMHSLAFHFLQLSHPDVAEADGVAVVLERDRALVGMGLVFRRTMVGGVAQQLEMVLDDHAIVKHRDEGRADELAFLVELRGLPNDVVLLPFTRLAAGVDERRVLLVNGAALAIVVRRVLVRVENLNLIGPHQKDTAVASSLAIAFSFRSRCPFDVDLTIAKLVLASERAGTGCNRAVRHRPLLAAIPGREVLAVEQDDRVGRGLVRSTRINHGRLGPLDTAQKLIGPCATDEHRQNKEGGNWCCPLIHKLSPALITSKVAKRNRTNPSMIVASTATIKVTHGTTRSRGCVGPPARLFLAFRRSVCYAGSETRNSPQSNPLRHFQTMTLILPLRSLFCWLAFLAASAATLAGEHDPNWIELFDGKSLDGWKASEHPDTWRVEGGLLVAHGERSHLFYEGPVGNHGFRNFELVAEVRTEKNCNSGIFFHTQYQESGWPRKGYEVQVNNSYAGVRKYRELKRTGSLYGVRNIYSGSVADEEWFEMRIRVVGQRICVWVNGCQTVDYVESEASARGETRGGRFLSRGTVALQGHDPGSRVSFRRVAIRPLSDDEDSAIPPRAPDQGYGVEGNVIDRFAAANVPVIDSHIHLRGGLTVEKAMQRQAVTGINSGVLRNIGVGWPIETDAQLAEFLDTVEGRPVSVGLQVNDRDWMTKHSKELLDRLDFVLADTMIMPMPNDDSPFVKLWVTDGYTIDDPEAWMERYVRHNLRVLAEPVTILANPTYLPPPVADLYDELWTDERMRVVIEAAVKNNVALEINARSGLPHDRFLRMARKMGATFSFGTNNFDDKPIDMTRCFEAIDRYGLKKKDMYVPGPKE